MHTLCSILKKNLLTCSCKWCKVGLQTPVTRQRSQFVVDRLNKKPMIINWKQNKQKEDNSWKIWSTVSWNSIVWYFPFFYLNFYLKHRGVELHCLIFSFLLSLIIFILPWAGTPYDSQCKRHQGRRPQGAPWNWTQLWNY